MLSNWRDFPREFYYLQHTLFRLQLMMKVWLVLINKIYVKTEIAQNDADLSCIKLDINVLKCCAFVKHLETLISSLIQDKSASF